MIFARKVEFDWSNQRSSPHEVSIYDTPFGLWIAEIDKKGYMLSLKPYTPNPHDLETATPLPFYEIPTRIKPIGTPFQMSVWEALTTIPHGATTYYSAIAAIIHNPLAARAVGSAIGCNKVIGFIPCHRVLAKDGTLGGFEWGLDLKEKLLAYEK
ncbi:MAG: MGMT family protein [Pseudomonadota bacterium]